MDNAHDESYITIDQTGSDYDNYSLQANEYFDIQYLIPTPFYSPHNPYISPPLVSSNDNQPLEDRFLQPTNTDFGNLYTSFQNTERNLSTSHTDPIMDRSIRCRHFSGYPHENALTFLQEFESYSLMFNLDHDDSRKIAAFHLHLQGPARSWFDSISNSGILHNW